MGRSSGLLLAMTGVDASGKSTQLEALEAHLHERGLRTRRIWTRAGYTRRLEAGKRLAKRLRGGGRSATPGREPAAPRRGRVYPQRADTLGPRWKRRLWLATALLDLSLCYAWQLRHWLRRYDVVICDRFLQDAIVDFRVNFPDDRVEQSLLFRALRRLTPVPDLSLVLVVPAEISMARAAAKDRNGRETAAMLEARERHYRALAEEQGLALLDARQDVATVATAIRGLVDEALRQRGLPGREAQRRGSPRIRSATMLR